MGNRALELYEKSRPIESLESFIFRVAQRASMKRAGVLLLRSFNNSKEKIEFSYEVLDDESLGPEELSALGGFAIAAAMLTRAILTRRTSHLFSALQTGAMALAFGGKEVPRLWRRLKDRKQPLPAILELQGGQMAFKVGEEAVLVDLAPVTGLTVRAFRFHWQPQRPILYFAHVEMQDGRVLTLTEAEDSVSVRRLLHHLAKPVPVELSFQNIDLYREGNRVTWEVGPRLVEPALN